MYKAFKLSPVTFNASGELYWERGKQLYDANQSKVKNALGDFIKREVIEGTKLQQHWFPAVGADIFLSHSHADLEMVLKLAGWLEIELGLRPFVDSCVWGLADNLLKEIDDKYCWDRQSQVYSYESRNRSTSHVHSMLSTALGMMIDKSECMIFLNTPKSITSAGVMDQTESPWIYTELSIARFMRRTVPERLRADSVLNFSAEGKIASGPRFRYDVDLKNFPAISNKEMNRWLAEYVPGSNALDALYEILDPNEVLAE